MGTSASAQEDPEASSEPVGLSPYVFAEAARGSLKAHRMLRDHALEMTAAQQVSFEQGFAVAEVFARLAASFGHPDDRKMLAGLLFQRADLFGGAGKDHALAQAIVQLDAAADSGDTEATGDLAKAAEAGVSKGIFDLAQQLRHLGAAA